MKNEKVAIIGAGPAGMRAAMTLVEHGLRPTVIDESSMSGGQIYRRPPRDLDAFRPRQILYGFEARKAGALHIGFDGLGDKIDYRPNTTIWSVENGRLSVMANDAVETLAWDRLVLAPGAMDRIVPVRNWTVPGVYTLGAAQIALKAQASSIGNKVVFFGTGPLLYLVAYQYAKAGLDVAAVLDTSLFPSVPKAASLLSGGLTFAKGLYYVAWLKAHGVRTVHGIRPEEITLTQTGTAGGLTFRHPDGSTETIKASAIAFGYGLKAETQIADLLDLEFSFDSTNRQWLPVQDRYGRSSCQSVYLAGDGAWIRGADMAELSGTRAALVLLADIGVHGLFPRIDALSAKIRTADRFRRAIETSFPFPAHLAAQLEEEVTLCRCEGVTVGAFRDAIAQTGESEINRLKAFTRVGMGRCQGRVCGASAMEIAASSGKTCLQDAGRLRGQIPVKPVPLSTLAGETR